MHNTARITSKMKKDTANQKDTSGLSITNCLALFLSSIGTYVEIFSPPSNLLANVKLHDRYNSTYTKKLVQYYTNIYIQDR